MTTDLDAYLDYVFFASSGFEAARSPENFNAASQSG